MVVCCAGRNETALAAMLGLVESGDFASAGGRVFDMRRLRRGAGVSGGALTRRRGLLPPGPASARPGLSGPSRDRLRMGDGPVGAALAVAPCAPARPGAGRWSITSDRAVAVMLAAARTDGGSRSRQLFSQLEAAFTTLSLGLLLVLLWLFAGPRTLTEPAKPVKRNAPRTPFRFRGVCGGFRGLVSWALRAKRNEMA